MTFFNWNKCFPVWLFSSLPANELYNVRKAAFESIQSAAQTNITRQHRISCDAHMTDNEMVLNRCVSKIWTQKNTSNRDCSLHTGNLYLYRAYALANIYLLVAVYVYKMDVSACVCCPICCDFCSSMENIKWIDWIVR